MEFPEAWSLFKLNIGLAGLRDEFSIEDGLLRGEFVEKKLYEMHLRGQTYTSSQPLRRSQCELQQ